MDDATAAYEELTGDVGLSTASLNIVQGGGYISFADAMRDFLDDNDLDIEAELAQDPNIQVSNWNEEEEEEENSGAGFDVNDFFTDDDSAIRIGTETFTLSE